MGYEQQQDAIWIEAEHWTPGEWSPTDANSDVIVTQVNSSCWLACFFSYTNIKTLTEKNKRTGENLSGTYFWSSDMILVDEVSRQRIEEVVRELINTGDFERIFRCIQPEDEKETDESV